MAGRADFHWRYFRLLEDDLESVLGVVEPCTDNESCYGPQMVKLILAIGSDVDVAFKDLMAVVPAGASGAAKGKPTIVDFRGFVQGSFQSEFDRATLRIAHSDLEYSPWDDWWQDCGGSRVPSKANPGWWDAYNKVKHERFYNYDKASLGNVLQAFCGLYVVLCVLAKQEGGKTELSRLALFKDNRFGRAADVRLL